MSTTTCIRVHPAVKLWSAPWINNSYMFTYSSVLLLNVRASSRMGDRNNVAFWACPVCPVTQVELLLLLPSLVTADSFNYVTHQATQSPTVLRAACGPISTHNTHCVIILINLAAVSLSLSIYLHLASSINGAVLCPVDLCLSPLPKRERYHARRGRHTPLYRAI